jgi:two-component system, cell cycle response regulator DivK
MPATAIEGEVFSILIIESDRSVATALATYLRVATDFHVQVAYDGEAGIEAALRKPPNVIICDVNLPRKNGFEVAKELCRALATKPLLMALTSETELAAKLFEVGYDRSYLKPAIPLEIETAIRLHELQLALIAH